MTFLMVTSGQFLLLASMLSSSLCAPSNPPSDTGLVTLAGDCYDYEVPVTTQYKELTWNLPKFSDNYDVASFFSNLSRRDASTAFKPISGPQNTTSIGNYSISATFCSPKTNNGYEQTVLVATAGLGFDSRYWASQMNSPAYSFVEYALSRGYSTFIYDRLGTGKSTKVSGYSESQLANELATLASLTTSLKQGGYTGNIGQPAKIVHVGHSFGSMLTHTLIAKYPALSDGVILTGIAYNATTTSFPATFEAARLNIANTVFPRRYPGRDSGYFTYSDIIGNTESFFHQGNFDKEILWYTQDIAQPASVMEFVTGSLTSVLNLGTLAFTGPVMILSGEFDRGNCGGNCNGILQHPAQEIFSNARSFEAVVHPGSGHGINFNLNATGAYGVMMDFVMKNIL